MPTPPNLHTTQDQVANHADNIPQPSAQIVDKPPPPYTPTPNLGHPGPTAIPMAITMETLHADITALTAALTDFKSEANRIQTDQDVKMSNLEIMMNTKHQELTDSIAITIASELTQINAKLYANAITVQQNTQEITALKALVANQDATILTQGEAINDLQTKLALGDTIARKEAREALAWANSIEGHQRRWCIRIMGIPAPETRESSDTAKSIAADIIRDSLKLEGIETDDMDCAH